MNKDSNPPSPRAEGSLLLEVLDGKLPTVVEPTETVRKYHDEIRPGLHEEFKELVTVK